MTDAETKLREALHRKHYYCEDTFYSCPFAPEGCANDLEDKTKCQCGADEHNAHIDSLVAGFVAAVRAETLREVRGVVEGRITGDMLLDVDACAMGTATETHYEVMARDLRERLTRSLDALAHPEGTDQ